MSDGIFQKAARSWAPPWFQRSNMGTLLESVGALWDVQAERLMDGRLAANPYAAGARLKSGRLIQCEEDVLPWHARDRGITLYETEPVESRRVRLSQHHQLKRRRGTHQGEMRNLQPYFLGADGLGVLPRIRIVHQSGSATRSVATWETLSGSLDPGGAGVFSVSQARDSNWDWDGQGVVGSGGKWSRFWVILYLNGIVPAPALWDDGIAMWDDGVTLWDGAAAGVLADWISMVNDWKSAHSILWGFAITWNDARFLPWETATIDPAGWSSFPFGNYGSIIDPFTGKNTRPPDVEWILDRS